MREAVSALRRPCHFCHDFGHFPPNGASWVATAVNLAFSQPYMVVRFALHLTIQPLVSAHGLPIAHRSKQKAATPAVETRPMNQPESWNDLLNDAYAVASILGVGGYIIAMLAL